MSRKLTLNLFALLCLALTTSVFAAAAEKAKKVEVKGMINDRTGDMLTVKTDSGDVTVVLTDDTKTKDNRGLIGAREQEMGDIVLIPGLKVDIEGTRDNKGQVVAKKINVDGDDLEASEMIQAGLNPTAQQVAAQHQAIASNEQRIAQLEATIKEMQGAQDRFARGDAFDVKGQATVNFGTGSTALSPADQKQLKQLAQNANKLPNYLIKVTGYADSSGDAAMNTKLSEDRAKAVVAYLVQQCSVPVRRVVAPGAMGEYGATGSNETEAGRAENRRVEVAVLYPKQGK
ncbi:MAG: OmpA family protein [Acidobacteria bacterium]|nr:MAG: OmpA family protein [Acidobacteriota bacterium]